MNPVVHFELPYKVGIRIMTFYSEAFGWKTNRLGDELGDYILATTTETDAKVGAPAGAINGGFYPIKHDWPDQYPGIVIGVEDISAAMKKINKAGGQVLGDAVVIPGFGLYVSFRDTEGNRNSIIQPVM
jgi:uncharacterized protein